jgi:hypothetical protein
MDHARHGRRLRLPVLDRLCAIPRRRAGVVMDTRCPRPYGCVISHACHECGADIGEACRPDAETLARRIFEREKDLPWWSATPEEHRSYLDKAAARL